MHEVRRHVLGERELCAESIVCHVKRSQFEGLLDVVAYHPPLKQLQFYMTKIGLLVSYKKLTIILLSSKDLSAS